VSSIDTVTQPPAAGFPHRGQPTGWFQVAWSGEIATGDVRPIHYFGQDLVVYRTSSGAAQVLDAHCQHMGAHLGYGGCIEGEDIVCPFHGWSWDRAGGNTMVPSVGQRTDRRRIRSWPTHESNGIIWTWHDDARREPLWPAPAELPGVAEGARYDVYPHCCRKYPSVRMRPQYVPENNVDLDHLHWVHRAEGPIELDSFGEDGWCFRTSVRITYGYGRETTRLTPDGPIEVVVDAEIWGLGYQFTYFPKPDQAISIQAQTPIDDERCDMFQSVVVYREPDAVGEEPDGMAKARVREQLVQIERDIPIWEHMRYLPNAALTRQEAKPVVAVRRWAQRFYPDPGAVGGRS
jgi:3-ketosteroid 9alpha-monooxygenase subunit A